MVQPHKHAGLELFSAGKLFRRSGRAIFLSEISEVCKKQVHYKKEHQSKKEIKNARPESLSEYDLQVEVCRY